MTNPRRMRRHARRMRRYGLQPMVVMNSGDPLPDLVVVMVARWLWRYRSELAPVTLAAITMVAAWILHSTHPHWWPVLAMSARLRSRPAPAWQAHALAWPHEPSAATQ